MAKSGPVGRRESHCAEVTCESDDGGTPGVWGWNGQKVVNVKWGDLLWRGERWAGVRALVVVMKRRNGRGAKGGRKVDP